MQQMQLTPITIVDNFFDDPDKIRNWALTLDYTPDSDARWPGRRTESLHVLDNTFFQTVCNKFFQLFFDRPKENSTEKFYWVVDMRFQLIDNKYGSGWVHTDYVNSKITALIYLSPNSNLSGGTSIYQEKKSITSQKTSEESLNIKEKFYSNNINFEEMEKHREIHNSQYEETVRISNIYNRLISFDSHLFHSAQDFFGSEEESRLTLVLFVRELYSNNTPIGRFRTYVY